MPLCKFVWAYCIFWFLVQDVGKILIKHALKQFQGNEDEEISFKLAMQYQQRRSELHAMRPEGTALANRGRSMTVAGPSMTLEQALARVTTMEDELKEMREVISKNLAPKSPSKKKKDKKKQKALEEDI